ncbi:type II toxin-antitoxin system HicB family antitoxin [Plectonema radiosum NIES-515]|uniref:Type II toxin-antitoxin system HicB family antitoxin n=1 Tax=Plectonema radiosum NIES-515 TaxID=2986073 RepID=A0ABT3B2S0_9CYAN|nr:type II toxin-antitoxin system HicB family antitoxin [Plectonema radiosum]MCV3215673.1 type II toxin-antitoxin system HicB family antitoxin [Plectonema radiosum NIES-515]
MKWRVILEPDLETGEWAVWCPELPGCVSAGETEQEALENIREAIALYLETDFIKLAPGAVTREVIVG